MKPGQKKAIIFFMFALSILSVVSVLYLWLFSFLSWDPNAVSLLSAPMATRTPFLPDTPTRTSEPAPSPTLTSTPTVTPSPTETPTPTLTPVPAWIGDQMVSMSLADKIGQIIMTGVSGQWLTTETCQFVQQINPGGIVYTRGNVSTPEQLRQYSAALKECVGRSSDIPILLALDHEGQYVTRFTSGVTVFPAALAQGATGDPDTAYPLAYAAGQELAYSGVNTVLGPVGDVLTEYDNTVISQRSFGGDPEMVAAFISGAVSGYGQAGVLPVLKHFPGHGGVSGDSHYVQPIDEATSENITSIYLPPFQSGLDAGAHIVMFSHVAFPAIDQQSMPATLSLPTVQLIREQMGFQGIILTDSMGMGAITGRGLSVSEASVLAVQAGVDMLLITSPQQASVVKERIMQAVQNGDIMLERIDEAVWHILSVKYNSLIEGQTFPKDTTPDWGANAVLSFDVGYRSVTVLRDRAELLPIPEVYKRILIIGPADGWGLYPILESALRDNGFETQTVRYSGPWGGPVQETGYLQSLPVRADQFDLVLVLTWDAHVNRLRYNDTWQGVLVNNLLAGDRPLIVAALKSPTDILEYSGAPTVLATYGTTRGQLQALADALILPSRPQGRNPLPDLP